jgi:hypothetical protein
MIGKIFASELALKVRTSLYGVEFTPELIKD